MNARSLCEVYAVPKSTPVGMFEAVLSPEGWQDSLYRPSAERRLAPDEIIEFMGVITQFFKECKTQSDFKKFCRKYGERVDSASCGFMFDCALMRYNIVATGYAVTVTAYRKEHI